MDGFQQVTKLYDENERQLDMFLAQTQPNHNMEEVSLEEEAQIARRETFNRNAIVNVNGSFIATSDTYKARAMQAASASNNDDDHEI